MKSYQTGLLGELRAALYLRRAGMRLVRWRYRTRHGEIDWIARAGDTLVFVEVKYRPRGKLGDGAEAVDARKQNRLRYAAACYLQTQPPCAARFDVIEISADGLRHLPNAF